MADACTRKTNEEVEKRREEGRGESFCYFIVIGLMWQKNKRKEEDEAESFFIGRWDGDGSEKKNKTKFEILDKIKDIIKLEI